MVKRSNKDWSTWTVGCCRCSEIGCCRWCMNPRDCKDLCEWVMKSHNAHMKRLTFKLRHYKRVCGHKVSRWHDKMVDERTYGHLHCWYLHQLCRPMNLLRTCCANRIFYGGYPEFQWCSARREDMGLLSTKSGLLGHHPWQQHIPRGMFYHKVNILR